MPPPDFSSSVDAPDLFRLIDYLIAGLSSVPAAQPLLDALVNSHARGAAIADGAKFKAAPDTIEALGALGIDAKDKVVKALGLFLAHLVAEIIGVDVPQNALASASGKPTDSIVGRAIARVAIGAIQGSETELVPGQEGAERFLALLSHIVVHGWFEGIIVEKVEKTFSLSGQIDSIAKLGAELVEGLGLSRLARVGLRPLAQTMIATPSEWDVHKRFRPTMLGPSTAARQLARGRWTTDQVHEELARAGYADDRIEALINEATKFLSADDIAWELWQGVLDQDGAVAALVEQGWDAQRASLHLNAQILKHEDAIHRSVADAATSAFVDGRIDVGALDDMLHASIPSDRERALLLTAARAKRALRNTPPTPAEAAAGVKVGLLAFVDYRAALERAGRSPDAVDLLELLLRKEVDDKRTTAQHTAEQQAEKDAAAKLKAADAAKKKADAEAAAALRRQGSPAELAHAVVRGLIPIERLVAVLVQQYDSDTVAIYTADVEQQRVEYVAKQAKAAEAAKRADARGLSTSELQAALVDGILTADQVRRQLTDHGIAAGDVDVLLATMQQRAADHAAAVRAHDVAVQRAAARSVDLSQAEHLVRAGHWTLAQYDALLTSLGFTEAARADLAALLNDAIAKDAAAAALRAGIASDNPAKGLSLTQARQAVLTGHSTLDAFQTYLVNAGYTADATATLVADVRDAVAAADAARARREATASAEDGRALPLAEVTKAARLGIISPAEYQSALVDRGFSDDAVALEMDLLLTELAATRAAQNVAPAAPPLTAAKGLALADLARAVKAGEATLDDYRARAVELGYDAAAVQTLTNVLADEVSSLAFATQRHTTIAGALKLQGIDLAALEADVAAGTKTLDAYEQFLTTAGYGAGDAALLRALLATKLPAEGG